MGQGPRSYFGGNRRRDLRAFTGAESAMRAVRACLRHIFPLCRGPVGSAAADALGWKISDEFTVVCRTQPAAARTLWLGSIYKNLLDHCQLGHERERGLLASQLTRQRIASASVRQPNRSVHRKVLGW